MNIVTTKEQDHDRKQGGAKQLTAGQVHENNLQELDRHRIYEQCQRLLSKPFGRQTDVTDISIMSNVMQRTPEKVNPKKTWVPPIKLNPRKLLRKLRKAAA